MVSIARSVQFSHSVVSDSLQPHKPQHVRPPCPSPTPRVYSDACPLNQWWHPDISSSVVPSSSCPQSFPASGSFPRSQFFVSGGQSIGVSASASVLPMNTQDWSPLGWTSWTSLLSCILETGFYCGNGGNSGRLYFLGAPKSLQMVTAAMKLKDAYSLEGKLWPSYTTY